MVPYPSQPETTITRPRWPRRAVPWLVSVFGMDAAPLLVDDLKPTFEVFELGLGQIGGTGSFLTGATGFNGDSQVEALAYCRTATEYQGERP